MRNKLRRIFGIFIVHVILSWMLFAGLRIAVRGYNRTHVKPIAAASLRVVGDTAELSVLTNIYRVPLPSDTSPLLTASYLFCDDALKFWVWVGEFIDLPWFVHRMFAK